MEPDSRDRRGPAQSTASCFADTSRDFWLQHAGSPLKGRNKIIASICPQVIGLVWFGLVWVGGWVGGWVGLGWVGLRAALACSWRTARTHPQHRQTPYLHHNP